jgi:hypothetical protein
MDTSFTQVSIGSVSFNWENSSLDTLSFSLKIPLSKLKSIVRNNSLWDSNSLEKIVQSKVGFFPFMYWFNTDPVEWGTIYSCILVAQEGSDSTIKDVTVHFHIKVRVPELIGVRLEMSGSSCIGKVLDCLLGSSLQCIPCHLKANVPSLG